MKSMTGFGRGTAPLGDGRVLLEIKTVNNRFLEVRSRAPKEFLAAEVLVEKLTRRHLHRGHCTVSIGYEGSGGGAFLINRGVLEGYLNDLSACAEGTSLSAENLAPVLAGAPDVFTLPSFGDSSGLEEAINAAFDEASSKLMAMRDAEGRAMASDIGEKLALIKDRVSEITSLTANYGQDILERSRQRLQALLEGTDLTPDSGRLELEAAILADKADINEEVKRLASHCDQMDTLLSASGPVGRRMEFLVQEMGREANTIGSKAAITELTHLVVELKAELEKVRELVQNVE